MVVRGRLELVCREHVAADIDRRRRAGVLGAVSRRVGKLAVVVCVMCSTGDTGVLSRNVRMGPSVRVCDPRRYDRGEQCHDGCRDAKQAGTGHSAT